MKFYKGTLAAFMVISLAGPAYAEGDAVKGEKVFKKCMACHSAVDATNKVGPSLKGVVGRKAASVEGYTYSAAMKKKGEEGVIWDEATLTAYLPKPMAFVPGTKMAFVGLAKPEDVQNIIAYMKAQSQ
jgi:cytochrome c